MQQDQGIVSRRKIYNFMLEYMQEHFYPPTIREICDAVGLHSTSTVHAHLLVLDRQGKIKLGYGTVRTATIPDLQRINDAMQVPQKIVYQDGNYHCPKCDAEIIRVEFMTANGAEPQNKYSWCWHCGQKLKWGVQDEDM